MYTVKGRVYGKAADGRTILLFTPGAVITDDEAPRRRPARRRAGRKAAGRGLVIESGERESDEAQPGEARSRA